ncbi:hypothetical protein EOI86_12425 [Hwanghaeella grinnelliae]|uniref:Uncharacterized protein n=1 Tax=Hwanghaeella grinnelliae TaxID=2500179 RepID=A0A3S2VM48_9PROT|nr:hypothetical protein [Hwanghaeella grinnelliae]RVU36039.1 hypothetical protein EOI86_12425 [Hwanghaeella grinnelliae]
MRIVVRFIATLLFISMLAACGTHMGSEVARTPLGDGEMLFFYDIAAFDQARGEFRDSVPGQFWKTIGDDELVLTDTALIPLDHVLFPNAGKTGKSFLGIVRGPARDQYLYWSGTPSDFFWSSRIGQQISMHAEPQKAIYVGTITYLFDRGRFGIKVLNNFERAKAEFLRRYPEFDGLVVEHIAEKGWRDGMILATREYQRSYVNSIAAEAAVMGALIGSQ